MTTVTLWLLMSIGYDHYSAGNQPTSVVERFATLQECERVREAARVRTMGNPLLRCVQATVVR